MRSPQRSRTRLAVTALEDRLVPAGTVTQQIIVDQIGWRADAVKVVVFADPQVGQNAAVAYTPGAKFEVRREADDGVVFTGNVVVWNNGMTDPVSGDKVRHGDFSTVNTPGTYYVYDPTNDLRSESFVVNADVYNDVLATAGRVFYYQRSGTEIPAQFGGNWTHGVDHVGEKSALQLVGDNPLAGSGRDVSGGWWDAGDYNKYVAFTQGPLWDLLSAYEWNPDVFPDAWNIPESGNGRADIIDLIKWETDWLLKMQLPDGSVLNRVGQISFDVGPDPATDLVTHYYTGPTTWATASFAASLAHASRVFAAFDPTYATQLRQAAEHAWAYLDGRPNMEPGDGRDGGNLAAADGSADKESDGIAAHDAAADRRIRLLASAELFRLTGLPMYRDYFDANYNSPALAQAGFQPLIDGLFDASLCLDMNRASVTYALSPNATPAVISTIKAAAKAGADTVVANQPDDPYLSFMYTGHYTYGSNELKANWGNLLTYARVLDVGTDAEQAQYRETGEEYLHYFHGRNPLSQTYLTNLGSRGVNLGAEHSVMEAYHSWWLDGNAKFDGPNSTFGPAPGYVVGGPNQFFTGEVTGPPVGEPPMKAYRDFNTTFNAQTGKEERSFEVNEPAIYTEAAYLLLVSQFSTAAVSPPTFAPSSFFAVGNEGGSVRLFAHDRPNAFIDFRPLDSGGTQYTGLVSVALGDVTGDGKTDLIVAPVSPLGDKNLAADKTGQLFVYDGAKLLDFAFGAGNANDAFLYSRQPFGAGYTNGLNIATGDVNGDNLVDIVVGSRGSSGGVGNPEQGRFVVIGGGAEDSLNSGQIGGSTNAFGNGYQKGCVVGAADLDGDGRDEVIVTRGGPVNNGSDLKVKAFRLAADGSYGLVPGTEIVPFVGVKRGGKVTGIDTNADGKSEFVISAIDPTTNKVLVRVFDALGTQVAFFSNPPSGQTGNVVDYAIGDRESGTATPRLVLAIDNNPAADVVVYLAPLTGAVTVGLDDSSDPPFSLLPGGVTLDGI